MSIYEGNGNDDFDSENQQGSNSLLVNLSSNNNHKWTHWICHWYITTDSYWPLAVTDHWQLPTIGSYWPRTVTDHICICKSGFRSNMADDE